MMAAMMPLAHAQDELEKAVLRFHNEMQRRGIKELPPREWAVHFRIWFDEDAFAREHEETLRWLAEMGALDEGTGG